MPSLPRPMGTLVTRAPVSALSTIMMLLAGLPQATKRWRRWESMSRPVGLMQPKLETSQTVGAAARLPVLSL